MHKAPARTSGHPFCREKEVAGGKDICRLMGNGEEHAWPVGQESEKNKIEVQEQGSLGERHVNGLMGVDTKCEDPCVVC